ncbi:hypothetical protein LI82_12410 [Methanococcoides methylutens]|uniref:Uncharacterized protein n=2 Tax=Archaea TaxID=2157 RepID=A0A099T010_METMT|nr:hypothetical protein [Methanococcoides methylutens]KGK98490.1 hypothetical protein LI82_12410 [Methanococcoides methylutens]
MLITVNTAEPNFEKYLKIKDSVNMEILLTTIIDTAMVIGLTAAFLFADMMIRHNLKMDLSGIGSDLAIGAFSVQISVIAALLTAEVTPEIATDGMLLALFGSLWATTLWQSSKRKKINYTVSFLIGTAIFSISVAHLLELHDPSLLGLVVAVAVILGYIGSTITKNLYNESIVKEFDGILGKVTSYDLIEISAKQTARDVDDPLSPVVDSIRCAIRNNDEDKFRTGFQKITTVTKNLMTGVKETTEITRHVNLHLLEMGLIALEKDSEATKHIVNSIGTIGASASNHGSQAGAIESLAAILSLFGAAKRKHKQGIQHQFAESAGDIVSTAAKMKHESAVEKGLLMFREIGDNAVFSGDTSTMTAVNEEMLEIARIAASKEYTTYARSIVITMRDIGTKALRLESNERQDAFKKLMDSFRKMGKIMSHRDVLEVVWAMRDLGIAASHEHLGDETSRTITELEEVGATALKDESYEKADEMVQQVIISLQEICISSMRSELTVPVSAVGTAFSRIEKYDEAASMIQDSVMDIAEYKTGDDKFYQIFLEKYDGEVY